ncbi:MAG TPA: hypothetical protein VGF03_17800 [Bryobacteraceae bacterium]
MRNTWCAWLVLAWASALPAADAPAYTIQTVAGSSFMGDGGPATAAQIGSIQGVAVDEKGNLYLSDTDHNRVRKVDAAGIITTIAGNGAAGFSGDGGPATAAQLNLPYGLAVDAAGYLYIADLGNNRVRRVSPDGTIATYAGTGVEGYSGDGGQATATQLCAPRNVAVDAAANVYIAEFEGHRVRKVTPAGIIATVAGTGIAGLGGDGGPAIAAQIDFPAGLAVDRTGALLIADSGNNRVRKVLPGGVMSTVLGGCAANSAPCASSSTALASPTAVTVDQALTIYVADASGLVRSYTAAGVWANFAGTGVPGYSGDGGTAVAAQLTAPRDLAADLAGDVFIADGARVRAVYAGGIIATCAGDAYLHAVGDGTPATSAILYHPSAVALDTSGNLYIGDTGTERVRIVLATGLIQTLAGDGTAGYSGDGLAATYAELNEPMALAFDPSGRLLLADTDNQLVREISAGVISTFAGTGAAGTGAEGLTPIEMPLRSPRGVCTGRDGSVYIVDTDNHRVLVAPPLGVVATFAGSGSPGDAGDGESARMAQLNQPSACALDGAGNVFIADTSNHRIRQVTATGVIGTVAGIGAAGYSGDGGAATAAALYAPSGVAVDSSGDIFIADTGNHAIRLVTPDGAIRTVAGQGAAGFSGDGGAGSAALLNSPSGIVLDGAGDLYFADTGNNRVRRLMPNTVTVLVGPPPVAAALALVNAASQSQGAVSPGEIVTLYGAGIGPPSGVTGSLDAAGLLGNLLAGAEVRFDGVPAPLFYAQASQVNAQVPYSIAGQSVTRVEVFYQGQLAGVLNLPVVAAAPALFAAALNQDGSLNSSSAPAARGTVVTFFGTGEGLTNGANIAGQPAAAPYPIPVLPVTLTVAGIAAQLLYAGEAPTFAGLLQVDAVIPGGFVPSGPVAVQLTVGVATSPPITVWLQ